MLQRCCSLPTPLSARTLLGGRHLLPAACPLSLQERWKHSNRQIKRLLAPRHPAYIRKHGRPAPPPPLPPPQFPPLVDPKLVDPTTNIPAVRLLPNGWTKPLDASIVRPDYPFTVTRTKNKPLDAIGFLPVYAKLRKDGTKVITRIKKVSGDREAFLREITSVLQLKTNTATNKPIRISAGGTIEIPGAHVVKVKRWLTSLGF
jgi:translation initiation factor 1 (eIF-1/SUI1)